MILGSRRLTSKELASLVYTESTARIRARELVGMLERSTGRNVIIDRYVTELFRYPTQLQVTSDLHDAKRIVKRYYQWGMREHPGGEYSAYVEVNGEWEKGFMWATHTCEPYALTIAALKSHIAEMK